MRKPLKMNNRGVLPLLAVPIWLIILAVVAIGGLLSASVWLASANLHEEGVILTVCEKLPEETCQQVINNYLEDKEDDSPHDWSSAWKTLLTTPSLLILYALLVYGATLLMKKYLK